MNYEASTFDLVTVSNAREAAKLIKDGKLNSFQAISYTSEIYKQPIYLVPDGNINDPLFEIAIIKSINNVRVKIETLTAGWIDTAEELAKYIIEAEDSNYYEPAHLVLAGEEESDEYKKALVRFICGHCGSSFTSTRPKQATFDQDSGYGICPPCEERFH